MNFPNEVMCKNHITINIILVLNSCMVKLEMFTIIIVNKYITQKVKPCKI